MRLDVILRLGVKLILPFVFVFALYVHFHGEYGPGGGFQAGVILAGMIILYALIFGLAAAENVVPQNFVERMIPAGVAIYLSAGVPAMLGGKTFLDYTALAQDPHAGHLLGVFLVETGVIVTVAATMIAIFYALVRRGRS